MSPLQYTRVVGPLPSTVPFVGPEAQERARVRPFRARIGANENAFGPSPNAIAAMAAAATESWMYGDPENHDLKVALARHCAVSPQNIVVGEGIDALFGYALRLFVEPGDRVVSSTGAYPTFNFHVTGFGGELVTVPYANDHEDPESLLAKAIELRPKAVYLANPDNPMGSVWPARTVEALVDRLPEQTVLMLDEAYIEFAPEGTAPRLALDRPNVIRYRTFSKAYGMAGARVAYAIAEASVAKSFDKIRNHFALNRMAQAGALAALADQDWLEQTVSKVRRSTARISQMANALGLEALPTAANFVAIDCGRDGAFAKRVLDALIARDVFVRMPGVAPLNRCIRITAGTDEQLDYLDEEFAQALADARV